MCVCVCVCVCVCICVLPLDLRDYKVLLSRWMELDVKGQNYKDFVVKMYH